MHSTISLTFFVTASRKIYCCVYTPLLKKKKSNKGNNDDNNNTTLYITLFSFRSEIDEHAVTNYV